MPWKLLLHLVQKDGSVKRYIDPKVGEKDLTFKVRPLRKFFMGEGEVQKVINPLDNTPADEEIGKVGEPSKSIVPANEICLHLLLQHEHRKSLFGKKRSR